MLNSSFVSPGLRYESSGYLSASKPCQKLNKFVIIEKLKRFSKNFTTLTTEIQTDRQIRIE